MLATALQTASVAVQKLTFYLIFVNSSRTGGKNDLTYCAQVPHLELFKTFCQSVLPLCVNALLLFFTLLCIDMTGMVPCGTI